MLWIAKTQAQHLKITGRVIDEQSLKPLTAVGVRLNGKEAAITDSTGYFSVITKPGKHKLIFSRVGYRNENLQVEEILEGERDFTIFLAPFVNQLNQVVIAGSRNAKEISREVSSVNIIQPYLITNTNATDLSEVLNKIPGIMVVMVRLP